MKAYILVISCLISLVGYSQSNNEQVILISENEQDSITDYIFPEIEISTDNDAYLKKYRKTKYFVRRVYAYSKLASNMLLSFQDTLEYIDSKRMKKRYLNRANKILKNEFGNETNIQGNGSNYL
jgi:hypothetical protein